MKIVILNECFFQPEHLERLSALGEVEVFTDTSTPEQATERLRGADVGIVDQFLLPYDEKVLSALRSLKLLALNTTSFAYVDIEAAKKQGIQVTNAAGFSTRAVAEHVFALIFAIVRRIVLADQTVRAKPFEVDPGEPSHRKFEGFELQGKTLGILGLGKIGNEVASIGASLGMEILAYNRTQKPVPGGQMASLKDVLKNSDVISINLALNEQTRHIIDETALGQMKPNAILVNAAVGGHVEAEALYQALKSGRIAGAGLDVLEPIDAKHPIFRLENVVFTPHIGFFTRESTQNLPGIITSNVEAFVAGHPLNLVN